MFDKILLPIDLNEESSWQMALPAAVRLAQQNGAEIIAVNVVTDLDMTLVGPFLPEDYAQRMVAEAEKSLKALLEREIPEEVLARPHVRRGKRVYRQIKKAANELGADVIVMASHRPENKDALIGPNAAQVMRHATQSVLLMR